MSILRHTLKQISLEKKSKLHYLELGVAEYENKGDNFYSVEGFASKTSVDSVNPDVDFQMLTEEFFVQNKKKYDIIYIDAGHELHNVVNDYNHCIDILTEKGVVFIHDLYPPTRMLSSCQYCCDGYKLLNYLNEQPIFKKEKLISCLSDVGSTLILKPTHKVNLNDIEDISWDELEEKSVKWGTKVETYPEVVEVFNQWI